MKQIIPILPCPDLRKQVTFYEHLGFELLSMHPSPVPYASMRYDDIEIHFYGSRKLDPTENASVCFIRVDDVDALCHTFTAGLKAHLGKVPQSGIPRISKVRHLKEDRRFTLVDVGGNTFYIGTPEAKSDVFLRSFHNTEHAQNFAVLYDLMYSKEDPMRAANVIPRLLAVKDDLSDIDRAKLLLVVLEIHQQLEREMDDTELRLLLEAHRDKDDWKQLQERYNELFCASE